MNTQCKSCCHSLYLSCSCLSANIASVSFQLWIFPSRIQTVLQLCSRCFSVDSRALSHIASCCDTLAQCPDSIQSSWCLFYYCRWVESKNSTYLLVKQDHRCRASWANWNTAQLIRVRTKKVKIGLRHKPNVAYVHPRCGHALGSDGKERLERPKRTCGDPCIDEKTCVAIDVLKVALRSILRIQKMWNWKHVCTFSNVTILMYLTNSWCAIFVSCIEIIFCMFCSDAISHFNVFS